LTAAHRFPTAIAVIVANCVPIVGVLAFGWDLRSIMFVYWLETAVIVFYSVLKVVTVGGPITLLWMPGHLAFFGVFMSFHLMMILALGPTPPGRFFPPDVIRELFRRTWSAGIGLVVSHGISFVVNFLGNGEYRHTTVNEQIAAPWKRVLIMHATTFVGAWSVMLFEAPVGALVMLAVLKIVVDLHGHLRERRVNSEAESPRSAQVPATTIEGVLGLFGAFLVFCGVVLAAGSGGQVFRASRIQIPVADRARRGGRLPCPRSGRPGAQRLVSGPLPFPLRRRRRPARGGLLHAQHERSGDRRRDAALGRTASKRHHAADPL